MISIKSIDHARLYVSNLETSVNFYTALFDFKIYEDDGLFKIIGNETVKLCLQEVDVPIDSNCNGFQHFGFYVENFIEIEALLRRQGISFLKAHWEESGSSSVYIDDPDGYRIELSSKAGGGLK
jgi:catechol 2,3-dioxygenase-like lactoylglutathione lyase family enzyme